MWDNVRNVLITQLISVVVVVSGGGSGNNGPLESFSASGSQQQSGSYYSDNAYRSLDSQLLRIGSRLDQLMLRMDHLDSRVGRVQSTGHLRFDSIETSMQTTRQRLDLWSNQLNMLEEQLTRKWKTMESRFESLVTTLDSKLDAKFNLIQRDNRRHNEFISQSFSSVIISQENMSERVGGYIGQLNTTLQQTHSTLKNATTQMKTHSSVCLTNVNALLQNITSLHTPTYSPPPPPPPMQQQTRRNAIQPTDMLHRQYSYNPYAYTQNATNLITTKVSNMFDELVKRSLDLEAIVKDTYTMSNLTRREVQDGFMALIPIVSQQVVTGGSDRGGGTGGSGEVLSMVMESLSTVEQLSNSLTRRFTELGRSINERFEVVSMTLNGFLESCVRIQEKEQLFEEKIVDVLWKILDSVDNSTRNVTQTWENVKYELRTKNATNCTDMLLNNTRSTPPVESQEAGFYSLLRAYESLQNGGDENNEFDGTRDEDDRGNEMEATEEDGHDPVDELSEDQKKLLWESLRLSGGGDEEQVPE